MLGTVARWNIFCFFAAGLLLYGLLPHLYDVTKEPPLAQEPKASIIQTDVTSTIWKRGKYESATTIKEKGSKSEIKPSPEHSSSGWVNINWKKNNDSRSKEPKSKS